MSSNPFNSINSNVTADPIVRRLSPPEKCLSLQKSNRNPCLSPTLAANHSKESHDVSLRFDYFSRTAHGIERKKTNVSIIE